MVGAAGTLRVATCQVFCRSGAGELDNQQRDHRRCPSATVGVISLLVYRRGLPIVPRARRLVQRLGSPTPCPDTRADWRRLPRRCGRDESPLFGSLRPASAPCLASAPEPGSLFPPGCRDLLAACSSASPSRTLPPAPGRWRNCRPSVAPALHGPRAGVAAEAISVLLPPPGLELARAGGADLEHPALDLHVLGHGRATTEGAHHAYL